MIDSKEHRLKWTEKAVGLRKSLSLEEKISIMSGNMSLGEMNKLSSLLAGGVYGVQGIFLAGGIADKGIPEMRLCDGAKGLFGCQNYTCFPATILRGAAFDRDLEYRIGKAIGKEVKEIGGNLFAGICINLLYHPGWGRSQETYGEESWHIGALGSALVEGVQSENVIACIKHFAFNSMEYSRFRVNITCTKRTEREVFLPHFKKCIDHGAAAVMSAYNAYNGEWCGENAYLLQQVLKKEWEFDGFVISDFVLGVREAAASANNGMDMEMCAKNWFGEPLLQAVKTGLVSEERIDESVLRIVRTLLATQTEPERQQAADFAEHERLALQAAREGITLIQNDNVLPLSVGKGQKIVVLGRLAEQENLGDHGRDWIHPAHVVTPLQGIADVAQDAEVIYYSGGNLKHAQDLAQAADAVIFVVGYEEEDEGECMMVQETEMICREDAGCCGDRAWSLELHEDDIRLLKTVGAVNEKSVAVLIGGGMIMLEEWKDSVGAILMAYYPGMQGGRAIADILFGYVNPSGKLPFVIPQKESDLPQIDWQTDHQEYAYYHGYTKLEKEGIAPAVPFGFGLSYTSFSLSDAVFRVADEEIIASCSVRNTGSRDGTEVVQMYIGFAKSKVERPVKILRGFERVSLRRGEARRVEIACPLEDVKWYNPASEQMELEHMEYEVFIGTSSSDKDLLSGKVNI